MFVRIITDFYFDMSIILCLARSIQDILFQLANRYCLNPQHHKLCKTRYKGCSRCCCHHRMYRRNLFHDVQKFSDRF